ncbi:MAG: hypothetical protein IJ437_04550 [Clostridia bacterium]|nr:hypothetical protein [Clostridia bacterium]
MKAINKALIAVLAGIISICAFSLVAFATGECAHTGGEATCTKRAECEICGEEYGELNPEAHTNYEFVYAYSDSNTHDIRYFCCGAYVTSQPHSGGEPTCSKKGSCYYCKAVYLDALPHNFSEASCTYPKTCYDCDATEGELLPHTGGEAGCLTLANCAVCGVEYGDILGHTGGNATCSEQAVCERCGESYGECLAHSGGTPTCQSLALCEVCGTPYGKLGDHAQDEKWTIAEEFHYNKCLNEGCLEAFNDADHEDNDNDGKCDICEYKYKLSQTEIVWIIIGSTFGALVAIGAIVSAIIVVKKKSTKRESK